MIQYNYKTSPSILIKMIDILVYILAIVGSFVIWVYINSIVGQVTLILLTISMIVEILIWRNTKYFIWNDKIIILTGILTKKSFTIKINDVDEFVVKQNLFYKLMNIKDILISVKSGVIFTLKGLNQVASQKVLDFLGGQSV